MQNPGSYLTNPNFVLILIPILIAILMLICFLVAAHFVLPAVFLMYFVWSTDSEEDEGEDSEAGSGADADMLESISLMEESLEELAQARSLLKAAETKVREFMTKRPPPAPLGPLFHSAPNPQIYHILRCFVLSLQAEV